MASTIGFSLRRRGGLEAATATDQPREFVDFVVGGSSLLEILTRRDGSHADYMSRIVSGFVEPARESAKELLAALARHRAF